MSDDQCCSVRGRRDPARVQLCVFFSFASILKSFILKLDMATAIILDIFVQDCSFLKPGKALFETTRAKIQYFY